MKMRLAALGAVLLLACSSGIRLASREWSTRLATAPLITLTLDDVSRLAADAASLLPRGAAWRDVDRDGDADVIAIAPDVPVVIWVNDGAGRFTRTVPAPPRPDFAPAPSFDDSPAGRPRADWSPAPRSLPSLMPGRAPRAPDLYAAGLHLTADAFVLRLDISARSSRAPPVPLHIV